MRYVLVLGFLAAATSAQAAQLLPFLEFGNAYAGGNYSQSSSSNEIHNSAVTSNGSVTTIPTTVRGGPISYPNPGR